MNCPNCNATNREAAKFCRRCGLWLDKACPNCRSKLPEVSFFCDQCGYQVSPIPAAGRQWLNQAARPVSPVVSSVPARDPSSPTAGSQSLMPDPPEREAASIQSPLQKYIPKELLNKLEAARASKTMAGERRIVTILFCDVKGSTAAAEQLDPEEWTEIINGAFEHMIKPVYQYEGTVARLMGDGILAFFGAPIAHEDDPQRAVLAGLDIVGGIQPYRAKVNERYGIDINVRVGINTGMVVVGTVGSDLRMEYTAMGDAINLAARIEETAQPGTVQIAEDTYRQVEPLFEFEDLGGFHVKGKEEPVPVYRVLGRKTQAGRRRGMAGLEVPMVGRNQEMDHLQESFSKLQKGVGGIVGLIGEAGLGKSRLIREWKAESARVEGSPGSTSSQSSNPILKEAKELNGRASWYETSSLSYEASQPYNLFRRLIRRVAKAGPNDPPNVLRQKIATIFETHQPKEDGRGQRVFESLFGLSSASGDPPLEGETFKQLFIVVTRNLWQARAQQEPTVLVCDDLHWADSASVEMLSHLFELTENVPLLIACSFRPERKAPGWQLKNKVESDFLHRYTELQLTPLSEEQSKQLLSSLAPGAEIPAPMRRQIQKKAAGIPYYLEEVVRDLIDQRALIRNNGVFRWAAEANMADFDLPDSLKSMLVARIDRLEEDARRTLQLASVVGRSFYYRVLVQMEDTPPNLEDQLGKLVRANMIQEAAREPTREYIFSNVLIQEAAYETILLSHRRQFHQQVGEALESLFPERREELAPVLAVHFETGRDEKNTLKYRTLAGDAAYRIYALDEAVGHYSRALEIVDTAEELQVMSSQLVHLYTRLGRAYELMYEYNKAQEVYEEMEKEAERRGDKALRLAYLLALATVYVTHSPLHDPDAGRSFVEEALALAKDLGDRRAQAKAHWNLMLLHRFVTDDLLAAKQSGEDSLEIARELDWKEQLAFTLNDLSLVYSGLGEPLKSLSILEEARVLWRDMNNLPMLADNLNVSGIIHNLTGGFDRAIEVIEEGLQVARSINNIWNQFPLIMTLSSAYREKGESGEALRHLRHLQTISEHADITGTAGSLMGLSQIYGDLGLVDKGLETCSRALGLNETSAMTWLRFTEQIHATQARLYLVDGNLDAAQKAIGKVQPSVAEVTPIPFMSINLYLIQSTCEVALASGEYDRVLSLAREFTTLLEEFQVRQGLPDGYYYMGRALLGLKKAEKAGDAFSTGRAVAEETGTRRILWRILASLAEVEALLGNASRGETLRRQAQEVITYIADHSGGEEMRASFLALPEVQAVMEDEMV